MEAFDSISFEKELTELVASNPLYSKFMSRRYLEDVLKGGDASESSRQTVLGIFFPMIRRRFKIFSDHTSSYELEKVTAHKKNDKIIVGSVVDLGRLGVTDLTSTNISQALKSFDVIACLFPFETTINHPINGDVPLKNKGPLVFITWELSDKIPIYKEDMESEKKQVRESYSKDIIVAHFIHGQYFLLVPNQSKYISKPTVNVFDFDKDTLTPLKGFGDTKRGTIKEFYNILFEKGYKMLSKFSQ